MGVIEVGSDNFRELVLESRTPVVVDFYADWCPSCRQIAPALDALAEKWDGRIGFVKIDVDQLPRLAQAYGVSSIPTVLLFESGEVEGRTVGAKSAADLEQDLGLASLLGAAA